MTSIRTRAALAAGVAAAALGAATVPASAASNVIIEVQIQAHIFQKDPAVKALNHFHPSNKAQLKAAIPKYRKLETRFRAAATAVAHSSVANPTQRKGRTRWVTGAREFAAGLHQFDHSLQLLFKGKDSSAHAQLSAADKKLTGATKLIAKADHTLGLG